MKRVLYLSICFILFFLNPIVADVPALNSLINLNLSLKELSLSGLDALDELILSDKYIILEGSVSSITEIERNDTNLVLDIHLINGEWIGLDKVQVYKCIVNISGMEWETMFPSRPPKEITDGVVLQNNRILVIGKISDYIMENSTLLAVVEAEYLRKIQ